jgi:tripartite-type tricarboxylate transporter receptor subunit TctC
MRRCETGVVVSKASMFNACRFLVAPLMYIFCIGALAQSYPTKTVRVIVPTGGGGGADAQGRLMSKRFSESMGQPFVVDNRPGAAGIIGADAVAKAAPDGYTLLATSSLIAVSAAFYKKLPFDPLKDLAPISQVAAAPQVLIVHPSVPARSVKDLVALAKQGRTLNAGSSGSGSANHVAIEMLKQTTGINVLHVPYKSGIAAGTALISGEVDFIFTGSVQAMPLLRSQRARALAVTSLKQSSALPGVPTMDSVYSGFNSANWYGMLAPAGTPAAIINRLHAEIVAALKTQEIRDFITNDGAEPVGSSPQEFAAYLRSEIERYTKVVKAANLKLE